MSTFAYVVTDVELDGFEPGANSMRSFASVAIDPAGTELGRFEAVLEPLPGSTPNADTLAWFRTQPPEVWRAATADPQPAARVMNDFATWVKSLAVQSHFVASPAAFDGGWIDYYLRRFTSYGLVMGPYATDQLFAGTLCLHSFAAGVTGADPATFTVHDLPKSWFGDVTHTHRAIDDALGYANLLTTLLTKQR
jgi:DNA polymerase III, alpha subunit (gram-positive type)